MTVVFFFLGLFFVSNTFSQNRTIADSLGKVLTEAELSQEERSRILSLRSYYLQDVDSSLISAKLALKIAKKINNPLLEAEAWEQISHIERRLGNNAISLNASLAGLRIYDSLGLTEKQAASYSQLANNSISDDDFEQAIEYLKKAKSVYGISDKNGNQILTFLNLGETYRLAGKLDSAAIYLKETLKRNEVIKHDIVQSYSLGNLGMVFASQGRLIEAKEYLSQAIEILKSMDDPYSTSTYLAELGSIYIKQDDLKIGEQKLLEAHKMASSVGLKEQIRDFSRKLSDFYKDNNRYAEALEYLELNRVYQDSLLNKESIKKIEQLKSSYEINKRETEIELLNTINTNQRNQMIFLGIAVLVFSLLTYMLYRSNNAIKKVSKQVSAQNLVIEKREQEKALLLKELNHRVKNNLQMISSLLNLQSRELSGHPAQEALLTGKNRVEALSLVHQKLYQEGIETKVFLKDYIEELVLGLFYGYNITFKPELDIDDSSISIDKAIPIALIVNEMVVNSLKYAYKDIELPKFRLTLKKVNDMLEITVSDNGVGFTEKDSVKQNSFGLKLIKSLITQLDGSIKRLKTGGTHWQIMVRNI